MLSVEYHIDKNGTIVEKRNKNVPQCLIILTVGVLKNLIEDNVIDNKKRPFLTLHKLFLFIITSYFVLLARLHSFLDKMIA